MQTLFPSDDPTGKPIKHENLQPEAIWPTIKLRLKEIVDCESYETWIAPLETKSVSSQEIVVSLPNLVFYQGIENEFLPHIDRVKKSLGLVDIIIRFEINSVGSARKESNNNNFNSYLSPREQSVHEEQLMFEVTPDIIAEQKPRTPSHEIPRADLDGDNPPTRQHSLLGAFEQPKQQAFSRSLSAEGNLDQNYTFDNFVKGDSNQFAVATCLSAAENPGKSYNPLFLYGSSGLGKTHLLHAVGNMVLEYNPNAVVTYISSERFMNEMIYCIRHNKMWDFRQKYRNCDVFLVDDIQFIAGKKSTQEEFFHTFNTLYAAKKQIVITSDLFPKDIPDIEDRLRNRFQWGLIADIQPPSIEHRIAILMTKAEKLKINLSHDVAEYIAKHAKRNVRILEGALHRINAFAKLQGERITIDLAVRTFKDVLGEAPKRLTIETIQKTVADHFKLRVADLKSKKRQRAVAFPRQIAMYLSRKLTNSSFPEIGDKFGGKDHTTVMHNVKKIKTNLTKDLDLKAHVETLERSLEHLQ